MRRTLLKIIFFGVLIIGFVVIQYSWLRSIQKDKQEKFKTSVIRSIYSSMEAMPLDSTAYTSGKGAYAFPGVLNHKNLVNPSDSTKYKLNENTITAILQQSFDARQLGNIPFEYSIVSGNNRIATRRFDKTQLSNSRNLVYYYQFQGQGAGNHTNDQLTVVIPTWEKFASKGMGWLITACLGLTILLVVVFCFTFIMLGQRQRLLYENRTNVIKDMVQQLGTPLSTVSVAVEALRNEGVMHDSRKINYYQQVIDDENKRMDERVNKLLRDFQ